MSNNIRKAIETAETATKVFTKHGLKFSKGYIGSLIFGILLMFVPFIIMTWTGIETNSQWLKMVGGIWRAVLGIYIATVFGFIALPVMYFLKGKEGIVDYGKMVLTGVLVALSTSLFLMITPLQANPQNILPFILCLIILGIVVTVTMNITAITCVVILIFIPTFLSFFFPDMLQGRKAVPKKTFYEGIEFKKNPPPLFNSSQVSRQKDSLPFPNSPRENRQVEKKNYPSGDYQVAVMIINSSKESSQLSQMLNNGGISTTNTLQKYLPREAQERIMGGDGKAVIDLNLGNYSKNIVVGKKRESKTFFSRETREYIITVIFDFWIVATGNGETRYIVIEKTAADSDKRESAKIATNSVFESAFEKIRESPS